MARCGPKLSIFGVVMGLWGVVMLSFLGLFFRLHSPALAMDIPQVSEEVSVEERKANVVLIPECCAEGRKSNINLILICILQDIKEMTTMELQDKVYANYRDTSNSCFIAAGIYILIGVASAVNYKVITVKGTTATA